MYLVIGVNQDEFGRGNSRPVNCFETEEKMLSYVARYNGNSDLLEVYEATRVQVRLAVSKAAEVEAIV